LPQLSESPPPLIEEIELIPLESQGMLVKYPDGEPEPRPLPIWRCYNDILLFVGVPVALAFIYFFLIAANFYASEAKFVVRQNSSGSTGGIASLVQSEGFSRATDETYVVNAFITSRDMVRELVAKDHLRDILDRPESDVISRFPNFYTPDNFEALYRRYLQWVKVDLDESTSITTLTAYAYRPDDARVLLIALLRHAEELINRLNARAHEDALQYANLFVVEAGRKAADVEARLTVFRNTSGTIDPTLESAAALDTIGKMNTDVAQLEAGLHQQIATMPSGPGIDTLRQRIASYHHEIEKLQHEIVGSKQSMSGTLATYEGLVLERSLAAKSLEAALANLDKARQEAQQQHLYLETITQPNLPDIPDHLWRWLCLCGVAVGSTGVWSINRTLRRGAKERGAS
jgi:capsular polysaccharide transport system permease protein